MKKKFLNCLKQDFKNNISRDMVYMREKEKKSISYKVTTKLDKKHVS